MAPTLRDSPGGKHRLWLSRWTPLGARREAAVEIELRRALVADEIVGRLPQSEDLSPGESLQIGKDCRGLLPVVADPG